MENLKHTKGEWVATNDDVYSLKEGLIVNIICDAPVSSKSYENWGANAKLISASPVMYEYILDKANNGCEIAKTIIKRYLY